VCRRRRKKDLIRQIKKNVHRKLKDFAQKFVVARYTTNAMQANVCEKLNVNREIEDDLGLLFFF